MMGYNKNDLYWFHRLDDDKPIVLLSQHNPARQINFFRFLGVYTDKIKYAKRLFNEIERRNNHIIRVSFVVNHLHINFNDEQNQDFADIYREFNLYAVRTEINNLDLFIEKFYSKIEVHKFVHQINLYCR